MPDIQDIPSSRQQIVDVEPLTPLAVRPRAAAQLLGFGITRIHAMIKSGELRSFVDGGRARRILMSSISEYVERRLKEDSTPIARSPGRPKGSKNKKKYSP